MVEVYVDEFMSLVIPVSPDQLRHVVMAVMMEIHDVFPPNANNSNNPISKKKLIKDEGQYSAQKFYLALALTAQQRQCG
jgi:hypothetical protein